MKKFFIIIILFLICPLFVNAKEVTKKDVQKSITDLINYDFSNDEDIKGISYVEFDAYDSNYESSSEYYDSDYFVIIIEYKNKTFEVESARKWLEYNIVDYDIDTVFDENVFYEYYNNNKDTIDADYESSNHKSSRMAYYFAYNFNKAFFYYKYPIFVESPLEGTSTALLKVGESYTREIPPTSLHAYLYATIASNYGVNFEEAYNYYRNSDVDVSYENIKNQILKLNGDYVTKCVDDYYSIYALEPDKYINVDNLSNKDSISKMIFDKNNTFSIDFINDKVPCYTYVAEIFGGTSAQFFVKYRIHLDSGFNIKDSEETAVIVNNPETNYNIPLVLGLVAAFFSGSLVYLFKIMNN